MRAPASLLSMLFCFAVLPLHTLYRALAALVLLRFPFFGCVLLRPLPPPPPLTIAARAVAALAAPRVRAACSARANTSKSGALKTCGHTFREISARAGCSGTVSAGTRTVSGSSVGTVPQRLLVAAKVTFVRTFFKCRGAACDDHCVAAQGS